MDNDLLMLAMVSLAATLLFALAAACLQWMSRNARRARLRPLALRALAGSVALVLPALAAIATFLYLGDTPRALKGGGFSPDRSQASHLPRVQGATLALSRYPRYPDRVTIRRRG